VSEGERLLAKSAARQWGKLGITVNCVAVRPELFFPELDTGASDLSLARPALPGTFDVVADIGPVVEFLSSDAAHYVTGETISVDGGIWMAP
jgi:NAD(P)-dependent dehydrogenase (short-subunit alcohol dehydrogenase family)